MPAVCGAPLTLTSSPLYPTSRLQHATHANHSNLTRTAPPQFNHCRPFTIQAQRITQDSAEQAVTSPSESQLISSQAFFQTQSRERSNAGNQPLTTPNASAFTSHSTTPFVPRFTSTRVTRFDDSERAAPSSLVRPSSSGARIIPMFARKRVQSHAKEPTENKNNGHTTAFTRRSAPTATTAVSRVPLVGTTIHAQNAPPSVFSLNLPQVVERERMENVFEQHNIHLEHALPERRICQTHQRNMDGRVTDGRTIHGKGESPSLTLRQGRTIELMSKNSLSYNGLDVPSASSPSTSTQVSKCLPQTRPGLVITQAPTVGHPAASVNTSSASQEQAGDTPHMEQGRMRGGNHLTVSGTPMSDISPGQLFEPFSTSFQSSGVLARKRQVPCASLFVLV